jgi:hypothetical protein
LLLAVPLNAAAAERALDKRSPCRPVSTQVWQAWTTHRRHHQLLRPRCAEIDRGSAAPSTSTSIRAARRAQKGADDMRFLALQPKKMLSFDWNAPPSLPQARSSAPWSSYRHHHPERPAPGSCRRRSAASWCR